MDELFPVRMIVGRVEDQTIYQLALHTVSCSISVPDGTSGCLVGRWQQAACGVLYKLQLSFQDHLPADPMWIAMWCINLFANRKRRYLGYCLYRGLPAHVVAVMDKVHGYKLYMIRRSPDGNFVYQVPADDDLSMVHYMETGLLGVQE